VTEQHAPRDAPSLEPVTSPSSGSALCERADPSVRSGAEQPKPDPLALEHVIGRYGSSRQAPAVSGISLSIREGQLTALLGPNGAGKSTVLRLAAGLLAPATGTVRLSGCDVRRMERRAIARQVAFVPQSEAIAVGFRVRDVVEMGRAPHQDGWMRERPHDRAAVEEAIARCDLARIAFRAVETLSGGERQRVAIARALASRPRVLLLDEPAASLDARHRLELHDLLAEAVRRDSLACLVSTHDLDAAARLADSVLLLREGRVVAAGRPAEVMNAVQLARTFDVDVHVGVHEASGRRYFVPWRISGTQP
jgi:iron complex transport system ATP-binding protein